MNKKIKLDDEITLYKKELFCYYVYRIKRCDNMKQINFETINYDRKEELKTFLTSFNDLVDKYNKSLENKGNRVQKLSNAIEKKNTALEKLNSTGEELSKRTDELHALKNATEESIKDLEAKKKSIDYTDSEVQKMEKEDIETLINAKKNTIAKIDEKINSTKEKTIANKNAIETNEGELKNLINQKRQAEESDYRTDAILKLTESAKEMLNNSLDDILRSEYIDVNATKEDSIDEKILEAPVPTVTTFEPVKEESKVSLDDLAAQIEEKPESEEKSILEDNDFAAFNFGLNVDKTSDESNVEETEKEETTVEEMVKEEKDEERNLEELDFDSIELPEEVVVTPITPIEEESNYKNIVEDMFEKEGIDYNLFDEATQIKLVENGDRVLKNMIVIKKHKIPLDLTIKQSEIYYAIEPQDLDDLLNIVTTDEDGNGMGFSIDYTYYILNELSRINVDKLIDVYNNEFMNINSKSGLISLLRLANTDLKDFEANRNINIETLKSLGVTTADAISEAYPEFINLDNPLFLNALNLFDKNDLVSKMNADIKIVPKILEYWKNN